MSWRRLSSRSKLMRHLRFEALEIRNLLSVTPWPLTSLTQPPALFVENQGQWTDSAIRYGCHAVGANIGITDSGVVFALVNPLAPQVELVSLNFAGASGTPAAVGDAVAMFNYFIGPPQAWRMGVPAYSEVVYAGLYDGVDLSLVPTPTDLLYRFELAPGVESGLIQLEFSGIAGLEVGEDGSLRVLVAEVPGALVQPAPLFQQIVESGTVEILGRWVLTGEARASFQPVDPYDPTLAVQIVGSWVWWPTFPEIPEDGEEYPEDGEDGLPEEPPIEDGGNGEGDEGEPGNGDVGDEDGNGDAGEEPEVPGENGDSGENGDQGNGGEPGEETGDGEEPGESGGNGDAGEPGEEENGDSENGSEAGGSGDSNESGDSNGNGDSGEVGDSEGDGDSEEPGEPGGNGGSGNGDENGESGDSGDNGDGGNGDDAGPNGDNGESGDSGDTGNGDGEDGGNGNGLPEEENGKDGWQPELPPPPTAFLVKVTPDGNPLGRVGFGWPNINWITEIAITPAGQWVNAGFVWAPLALATTREGLVYTGADAFVAKWASEGPAIWCTFFGGSADDFARAVAVDSAGDIVAAGHTRSHSWFGSDPEVEEADNTDLFVAKLDADGALVWTIGLGGSGDELGLAVVVDDQGDIFVTGQTSSAEWVAGGGDTTLDGPTDAYVVKLSSAGIHQWSTFIGGEGDEVGLALAVDEEGYIWVLGLSTSPEWVADGLEPPPYYTVQEWMGILFGGRANNPPTAEIVRTVDILPADVDTSVPVKVADLLVSDDGLGTIQLRLSGPDAELFEVDPSEGDGPFTAAVYLRSGVTLDPLSKPVLELTVEVDDLGLGRGPEVIFELRIPVAYVFTGTPGSDVFHFRPGPQGSWIGILNGKQTVLPPTVSAVVFRGLAGNDLAVLRDSPLGDRLEVRPDKVLFDYGAGLRLELYGCESVDVYASPSGERDVAVLRGGAELPVRIDITPAHLIFRAPGQLHLRGFGFRQVIAHGSDSGADRASLWLDTAQSELIGQPGLVKVSVSPLQDVLPAGGASGVPMPVLEEAELHGFEYIRVQAGAGIDSAVLSDGGEGRRDTFAFRAARGHAYLTASDYQITLLNFDQFEVTASDREDRAFLIGGDGDTTFTFRAAENTAEMTTVGRWDIPASANVAGFGLVRAFAGRGGTSVARFYDSPETADRFWGSPKWAALSAGGLYGRADAFGAYEVYFSGGGGGDVSTLYDDPATSDQLVSQYGAAILTYGGRVDRYILSHGHRWLKGYASGFPEIVDEAHVYIPAGSNNQQVRASFPNPQLVLTTDNHYAYVKRFKVVKVHGNVGENAIARVWDSVGDEHLFADGALHPRRAVVTSGEYSIELENLAQVTVVGVEGGDNTREIRNPDLLDFALETVGDWRDV